MSDEQVLDSGALREAWPLPEPDASSSKHDRGTVVIIGGAAETPGAVLLAGLAALRVGAGRLTMATAQATAPAVAVTVPEAAVSGLPVEASGGFAVAGAKTCQELVESADAVLLGPGMQGPKETRVLVEAVIPRISSDATIVLDALALTCGACDRSRLSVVADRTVITPNLDEARRLLDDESAMAGAATARALAETFAVVAVVGSLVASPDGQVFRVLSGNVGLATSGSGDVLAGAVAGLAARGTSPLSAALWGRSLHGGAGDRLAERVGPVGFLARELLDELPVVLAGAT